MSVRPNTTLIKDPNAILIYDVDWSAWLGDTAQIASGQSSWTISGTDAVLTKDQESVVTGNQIARVRLSAGTTGEVYKITNRITTNESPAQTDERSFFVRVKDI